MGNALRMGERQGRTTAAEVDEFLAAVRRMPITSDGETLARAWSDALVLARTHLLTVYDASYLELAHRRGLPLATLDKALKKAAVAAGVGLYIPPGYTGPVP